MKRHVLLPVLLFISVISLQAQTWHVASKNGCGIDGYITYVQKDSVYEVGYLGGYELGFQKVFTIHDTILQFSMLDEYRQRNFSYATQDNVNNLFILTTRELLRCTILRAGGVAELKIEIADTLQKSFDSIIPLKDSGRLETTRTILISQLEDSTLLELYDWSSSSVINSQYLRGKMLTSHYKPHNDKLTVLQSDSSQTWLQFLNTKNLEAQNEIPLSKNIHEFSRIGIDVDDINIIGRTDSGFIGIFYYELNDTILKKKLLPFDTICGITADDYSEKFYINGKIKDSMKYSLSSVSFNQLSINNLTTLKCTKTLESSILTGFNISFDLSISFTYQADSHIYYIPDLENIRIDSIKTDGFPGPVLATWGCYVGVEKREAELLSIQAFPNPAKNQVNIILGHLAAGEKYLFEVYDSQGRKIYDRWVRPHENFQINTSQFPKGMLILKLHGKQLVRTKKVINQ